MEISHHAQVFVDELNFSEMSSHCGGVGVVPDMGMYKIDTSPLAFAYSPKLSALTRFVEGAEMFLFPTDEQRMHHSA